MAHISIHDVSLQYISFFDENLHSKILWPIFRFMT